MNWMAIISIIVWALIITLFANYVLSAAQNANSVELKYGQFRQLIKEDKVESVEMTSSKYTIYLKEGVTVDLETLGEDPVPEESGVPEETAAPAEDAAATAAPADDSAGQTYEDVTGLAAILGLDPEASLPPALEGLSDQTITYYCAPITDSSLIALMEQHGITDYGPSYQEPTSPVVSFLVGTMLPMAIIFVILMLVFQTFMSRAGGGLGGVGKSHAKVYVERKTGVTFRDVAGQDEAKESLEEIIDILHNPQKYTEIGAKLPKGALLVGPPGTGKTLLAKAVAGEAGVPFFSISGSDFVEMFVGVGASRVRDLFKEAAKMAPCIIFIDEIDTIGKSRDNRMGGNDEREQTLNQLLAELDGFDPTKGVIVLAATNRPEVLDQALLRPGRFDRRVTVDRPNLAGRIKTLQVHTRNIRLAEDVDLEKIALATAGAVGADLANLVNEGALRAVRMGRKAVNQNDLLAAFELVIAGAEKKGSVLSEFEKRLVAYHEVGHAMVAFKQKNTTPVQKITIVPHTQGSLGYTLHLPEEDKNLQTRDELLAEIATYMGGRAAEELVLHVQTNGAAQDIQQATNLARNMISLYGMSDKFGMMALASRRTQYLEGGYALDCAQDTAADLDRDVMDILHTAYDKAVDILSHNREDMDKVVAYLLEKETITGAEMMAILEGRDPATAEQSSKEKEADHGTPIPLTGEAESTDNTVPDDTEQDDDTP
ncbi:MAG: ATP-dependent zinc metalloprotease FtsH [Oscillospiraceae bacterium]|nr:ATP-dependent zinc metalloprotease FtsH [Oscillospiraceae bacterium]